MKQSILCCLLLFVVSFCGYSDTIKIATTDGLAIQKVALAIMSKVYKDLGIATEITVLPAVRATHELKAERFNAELVRIYSYQQINPDLVRIPTPIGRLKTTAYTLSDFKIDPENLANYRYAIVRGIKHTNDLVENYQFKTLFADPKQMFQFIMLGRGDIALTAELDGSYQLKQLGLSGKIVANGKPWAELNLYHYIHNSQKETIKLVADKLAAMHESGELQRMWKIESQKLL